MAYWFVAPYIRDVPHLKRPQLMSKLLPATGHGTMGRAVVTGDSAVNVWDVETCLVKKSFSCGSQVLVLAVQPFLGLIAAGEARRPRKKLEERWCFTRFWTMYW